MSSVCFCTWEQGVSLKHLWHSYIVNKWAMTLLLWVTPFLSYTTRLTCFCLKPFYVEYFFCQINTQHSVMWKLHEIFSISCHLIFETLSSTSLQWFAKIWNSCVPYQCSNQISDIWLCVSVVNPQNELFLLTNLSLQWQVNVF